MYIKLPFSLFCLFTIIILLSTPDLNAQKNLLRNGSFEQEPAHSITPSEWENCGELGESPPDIHPSGTFTVELGAKDGETYLGLVVRDNGTNERIAQALDRPLKAGKTYLLKGYMTRSKDYISISRLTNERANYNTPVILRVHGAVTECQSTQILAVSAPNERVTWDYFELILKPQKDYPFLMLEAFYDQKSDDTYNGNLLLDGLVLVEQ